MTRVTIRDVAERAGVSTATVSRALSGAHRVSDEVASLVHGAAKELGYRSNVVARSLRRNRTDTVGMVVPSIGNPFFTSLVMNIEPALATHGLQLFLCDSQSSHDVEASRLQSLVARRVDGILISPCDRALSAPAVQEASSAVPVVQLDRFADGVLTDWVGMDDDEALTLVMAHLSERGVRTAAFITSTLTNSSTQLRREGFLREASRVGIETRDKWIRLGTYSIEWGRTASRSILSRSDRPGAVVCADDLIALGVLQECQRLGLSVPGDVLVTGMDDIPFAALSSPPLTTVRQPQERIASEAVRLLTESVRSGRREGSARIALSPKLIVRQSTS